MIVVCIIPILVYFSDNVPTPIKFPIKGIVIEEKDTMYVANFSQGMKQIFNRAEPISKYKRVSVNKNECINMEKK